MFGGARGSHTIAQNHDSITSSSVDITSSE